MFDLYSRERIDVKADMWVCSMLSPHAGYPQKGTSSHVFSAEQSFMTIVADRKVWLDLQSLGVLLSYICSQQLPFVGDCKLQVSPFDHLDFPAKLLQDCNITGRCGSRSLLSVSRQVLNGDYNLPTGRPEPFLALIRGLLRVSPSQRLGIDAVLQQLERLASKLPAMSLPPGPPFVSNGTTSSENGAKVLKVTPRPAPRGEHKSNHF